MNLAGLGMLVSVIGGVCFVLVMVMTAFKGEPAREPGTEFAGVAFGEVEVPQTMRPLSQWAYTAAQIPGMLAVLLIWGIAFIALVIMSSFPIS